MSNKRMEELVRLLNEASDSYYNKDVEIMSNYEYDALYDELVELEVKTGVVLENSPTLHAGYDVVSKLKKVEHEYPALSLNKIKDRDALVAWLKGRNGDLSWKMDGLTVVVTYNDGKMEKAVTRGNGYIGEDITHNAKFFKGLPKSILFKGKLIIRGEAVMSYKEFEKINSLIPDAQAKYKNARNLASATVRLLDSKESSQREINFFAFDLVYASDESEIENPDSNFKRSLWLHKLGFQIVSGYFVTPETVVETVNRMEKDMPKNRYPSDGLVLIFDEVAYGKSLGMTGKYPRNGIAFKWKDETVETTVRGIEWSASRTGLLNPVAVFDPVELEGTTVSRASVHNVSIAESLNLGTGSTIKVFKANLIIPQIAATVHSTGMTPIPHICPVCSKPTVVKKTVDNGITVKTLHCENPNCPAKHIGRFSHFVSRDCMNIVGLSDATLEKFIDNGLIRHFADIYHLNNHREYIVNDLAGFGEKSFDNLIASIEASRKVKFSALLNAIGIQGIGKDMAKSISKHLGKNALNAFVEKLRYGEDFGDIDGVGEVINKSIYDWKANVAYGKEFADLVDELTVEDDISSVNAKEGIAGKTFVITGSVNHFANRDELKSFIESLGGKTSGSVSTKTDFLINNDVDSTSGKNKKAKELGVKIISEDDFIAMTK